MFFLMLERLTYIFMGVKRLNCFMKLKLRKKMLLKNTNDKSLNMKSPLQDGYIFDTWQNWPVPLYYPTLFALYLFSHPFVVVCADVIGMG